MRLQLPPEVERSHIHGKTLFLKIQFLESLAIALVSFRIHVLPRLNCHALRGTFRSSEFSRLPVIPALPLVQYAGLAPEQPHHSSAFLQCGI